MRCEADQSFLIFGSDGDNEKSTAISSTLGGGKSASSTKEASTEQYIKMYVYIVVRIAQPQFGICIIFNLLTK